VTKIFPLVASWLPNEEYNFEPFTGVSVQNDYLKMGYRGILGELLCQMLPYTFPLPLSS